eukprot:Sspe_Gene.115648::Locus_103286_Transcript_1_1_Confidence_1.000_Length_473::g.115648::m.115648
MGWGILLAYNIAWASALAGISDAVCQGIEMTFRNRRRDEEIEFLREMGIDLEPRDPDEGEEGELVGEGLHGELVVVPGAQILDLNRLGKFVVSFGVVNDVPSFFWYTYGLPRLVPGSDVYSVTAKVVIDQALFAP